MSYFLNNITPINQFTKTTKEKYFVDKSELIEHMNKLIGTASQYVCITRPRRFGKTLNAPHTIQRMQISKNCLIILK